MTRNDRDRRRSVNILSFAFTCLFLFVAVQLTDGVGNFASKINTITANLDKAVLGLRTTVNYTDFEDNAVYVSNITFQPRGMTGLYNLNKMFINLVVPEDILMEGLIEYHRGEQNPFKFLQTNISAVASYYRGLIAMVLFLVLCVVLFPICYLFFACCRCCGNCGGRSQPADKRKDLCKKLCQGTLLIVLSTGLLFCIVCAFVSNEQLKNGVQELPTNLQKGIQDTNTFLNSTSQQISVLLLTNYEEFSGVLIDTLKNSSSIVVDELENYSNATAMLNLRQFADNLENVNKSLYQLQQDKNDIQAKVGDLRASINILKAELQQTLIKCLSDKCNNVYNTVQTLNVDVAFDKLPDLTDTIKEFDNLNISAIRRATEDGEGKLNEVKDKIKDALDTGVQAAISQIKSSSSYIQDNMDKVTNIISKFQNTISVNTDAPMNTLNRYIKDYSNYPYYIGLGISCVLLLVTICIALGLICGICGKRPDGYSDNCCNKGAGSQFLICAVTIMFIFGFVISLVTLVISLVGITSDRAVCATLKEPNSGSQIMKLFNDIISFEEYDVTLSTLLKECEQNESIYKVLNLESQFNLTAISAQFNISKQLDKFSIDDTILVNFNILSDDNIKILQELTNFNPPPIDKYDQLKDNITTVNMDKLSNDLTAVIVALNSTNQQLDVVQNLTHSLDRLNFINQNQLIPLKQKANDMLETAVNLDETLRMNHSTFPEAIDNMLTQIQHAQSYLQNNGSIQLKTIIAGFKKSVTKIVEGYMERVEDHITNEVGSCSPINMVISGVLASTCDKILQPMNGYWFSLFWTIILYIITIIVAVKLANLYQKYKPYGQGYVETRGGKRGKKKGKKPKRYEERPPNMAHGPAVRASHPVDGRYDDMAPKHWEDFPNGGPPHYHRAPTEYERPPPYYYPGAAGDH